ncbi:MAG: glycosyltransferase family 4 protein [Alphaproteobacteria bacterium]|nr:glycosyltransferase family 4 protein [Alphaproteobacteria bacterium]
MNPALWRLAIAFLAVLPAAWLATAAVLRLLHRNGILDRPNARSSHAVPTPRGGGLAIMATVLPAWTIIALSGGIAPSPILSAVAGAAALALLSWWDDRGGLSPALRILVQSVAVIAGLAALPGRDAVFQGWLPPMLDLLASALLWLWFVNLFNFMDGIDGLAGTEAAAIGIGIALLGLLDGGAVGIGAGLLGVTLAAGALGFLCWNWHPARLFMGDVGSVPLGYLLGWLLLALASAGLWAPALILPLYFLADASWTLARRLLRGDKIWQAHREHFYQRAVRSGRSHAAVVRRVLATDLVLVILALWAAAGFERPALALAAAAVGLLLADLSREKPSAASGA